MKLNSKIILLFLSISMIPVIIFGVLSLEVEKEENKEKMLKTLAIIAKLETQKIEEKVALKIELLNSIASRTQLRISLNDYLETGNTNNLDKIHRIISDAKESISGFNEIFILDNQENFIISTDNSILQHDPSNDLSVVNGTYGVVHISHDIKSPEILEFETPLTLNGKQIGFLKIHSNIYDVLPIRENYKLLGESAEYLIAKRNSNGDAQFLHDLRYVENQLLDTIVSSDRLDIPTTHALLKEEAVFEDLVDYAGIPVYSATGYANLVDWGIIIKISQEEVQSNFFNLQMGMILILVLISMIIPVLGIFFSRRISQPIEKLNDELFDFKNALDKSSLVAITDDEGIITYVNEMFCNISKYSKEELIGMNHSILKSGHHSVEFYKNLWGTISLGNIWKGDIKNKAKDGTYYWVRTTISPIFDEHKKIERYIAIRTDISSQIELAEKLIKSEKLSSIGGFASRMSHDIRNPLSIIRITLENLKIIYGVDDLKRKQFDKIDRSIGRIVHQIDGVLDFVRNVPLKLNKEELFDILDDSLDSLNIPSRIKLILPKNNINIVCDIQQLSVAISNLILNSIQSIDTVGTIEITCEENSDTIIIQIKDSGNGISQKNIDKLFDPLFTTKQQGTGLGLASVKSIIESHGGVISVTSPPTIFTITLPKISDKV